MDTSDLTPDHPPASPGRFRYVVTSDGETQPPDPADLIRAVWAGTLSADRFSLEIEPIQDADDPGRSPRSAR